MKLTTSGKNRCSDECQDAEEGSRPPAAVGATRAAAISVGAARAIVVFNVLLLLLPRGLGRNFPGQEVRLCGQHVVDDPDCHIVRDSPPAATAAITTTTGATAPSSLSSPPRRGRCSDRPRKTQAYLTTYSANGMGLNAPPSIAFHIDTCRIDDEVRLCSPGSTVAKYDNADQSRRNNSSRLSSGRLVRRCTALVLVGYNRWWMWY